MIARASTSRTNRIARRDLEQFRQSIESWERHRHRAGRDGDVELAAAYAEYSAEYWNQTGSLIPARKGRKRGPAVGRGSVCQRPARASASPGWRCRLGPGHTLRQFAEGLIVRFNLQS